MVESRRLWPIVVLQTLLFAVASYFFAAFVFAILLRVSELPRGAFWDDGVRAVLLFLSLTVVVAIVVVPLVNGSAERSTRTLSLFSTVFLIGYAALHATGALDPNIPLDAFVHDVIEPLRRMLRL